MVLAPELDDFFGVDRNGHTVISSSLSKRPGFTAWFFSLAVGVPTPQLLLLTIGPARSTTRSAIE